MAKISDLFVDPKAVDEGRWIDYLAGVRLRVARFGNEAHAAYLREAYRPHLKGMREGKIDPATATEISKTGVARHVLRDWSGLDGDDGKPLPYSPELAIKFFENPKLRDLYAVVVAAARHEDAYRESALEDARGN